MRFTFLLFGLFFCAKLIDAEVIIRAENKEYAGQHLEFFSSADPITTEKTVAFVLEFDRLGKSRTTINPSSSISVFCDFGIYRGMLLIEPNAALELKLPPLRQKSFADEKNPYFMPLIFWFATANPQQTNNRISDFDVQLNQLTDKYFDQLYFRQSRKIYDSLLYFIDKKFDGPSSESFQFHKEMKLKMVEAEAFRLKPEHYSQIFAGIKTDYWLRPSFTELFGKTFGGQLSFEAKTLKGAEIRNAVNNANLSFLLDHVTSKYNISGGMAELALLKMLHDAFYSGDFSKAAIQKMIKSERFTQSKTTLIKVTAKNISEKLSHLQPGTLAAPVCLKTIDGQSVCTNSNKTKFKYLVFADTEMSVCREQLKNVTALLEKFGKHLEIFVILRNTNAVAMKKYLSENKIGGVKLMDETGKYIEEYNVKSYPQCFLLDENHRVKFEEAKAPLDGFEQQFGNFLQRELFERQ